MTSQTEFRSALLDATMPVPSGLLDGLGNPAGARYSVYRNNVAVSLTEALATAFPVIQNLIGEENFQKIAAIFLRQDPPTSPLMMHYGAGFPAFLQDFEPLAHIGYLADIARLEHALRQSYHAADSAAADPTILQSLSEDALMACKMRVAPSVRVLSSSWPLVSIWAYARDPSVGQPPAVPQDCVILRPEFDPMPHILPNGGLAFVTTLAKGQTFGAALTAAGDGFDLAAALNLLLSHGAITDIQT